MKFRYLFLLSTALIISEAGAQGLNRAPERAARDIRATCSQPSGDKLLTRVSPETIEVRSGSGARSISLSEIASIDVTGPVNRSNRFAWATVKGTSGEAQRLGLVLPNAGSLLLEGYDAQGKPESIDVLDCTHLSFKAS